MISPFNKKIYPGGFLAVLMDFSGELNRRAAFRILKPFFKLSTQKVEGQPGRRSGKPA
jgi:hypothetical protein